MRAAKQERLLEEQSRAHQSRRIAEKRRRGACGSAVASAEGGPRRDPEEVRSRPRDPDGATPTCTGTLAGKRAPNSLQPGPNARAWLGSYVFFEF